MFKLGDKVKIITKSDKFEQLAHLKVNCYGKIGKIFNAKIDKSVKDDFVWYVAVDGVIIHYITSELELVESIQ